MSKPSAEEARKSHTNERMHSRDIPKCDLEWRDIGSGMMANTFRMASKLVTTTKGGPAMGDIAWRRTYSLTTGKLIDECEPDEVRDSVLHRELKVPDNIRVEITMKNAAEAHWKHGDIAEVYSRPRIAEQATAKLYQHAK